MYNNKNIIVIDLFNLVHEYFYVIEKINKNTFVKKTCVNHILKAIYKNLTVYYKDKDFLLVLAVDPIDLRKGYKFIKKKNIKGRDYSTYQKKHFFDIILYLVEVFKNLPVVILRENYVQADDLAYLVSIKKDISYNKMIFLSNDIDWNICINNKKQYQYNFKNVDKHRGDLPIVEKAIYGVPKDNIPRVLYKRHLIKNNNVDNDTYKINDIQDYLTFKPLYDFFKRYKFNPIYSFFNVNKRNDLYLCFLKHLISSNVNIISFCPYLCNTLMPENTVKFTTWNIAEFKLYHHNVDEDTVYLHFTDSNISYKKEIYMKPTKYDFITVDKNKRSVFEIKENASTFKIGINKDFFNKLLLPYIYNIYRLVPYLKGVDLTKSVKVINEDKIKNLLNGYISKDLINSFLDVFKKRSN